MFGEYVAGIGFSDGRAQLVVLEVKKHLLALRHLMEFEKAADDPLWFLQPIIHRNERIIRKVKSVSIAIDNASVHLHSFPTDNTLSQSELNDHLAWELSQFIPDYQPKEYINDLHVLRTHAQQKVSDIFVVSAKRSFVSDIQHALSKQKCGLNIADTNHFGAEYALAASYPAIRAKKIALVGVMRDRADLGILVNGRLTAYRYQTIPSESDVLDFIAPHVQTESVSDIFFYGSSAGMQLANNTRGRFGVDVSLLDPFKMIDTKSYAGGLDRYAGHEHVFASAVGCALRKQ